MKNKVARTSIVLLLVALLAMPAFAQRNADVDNIGNRNINSSRSILDRILLRNMNFTSFEKEIQLGRQLAAEIERQVKLLEDPVINEYVNRVGQNLVRNSDAQVPFTIKVVESDEINAFALPGGFFYINSGLIMAADDEAELAAVMAHEIAHVTARHGTEAAAKQQFFNFAALALVFVGGPVGFGARQAAGVLIPLGLLEFSRDHEEEADFLGLQYLWATGYDPNAAVGFFEKLQARETLRPGTIPKVFRTHPPTEDRVVKTKGHIETILPVRNQYVLSTSEFDTIKMRLASLENRMPVSNDDRAPSLQRRTPGSSSEPELETRPEDREPAEDDRPVLRRTR